MISFVNYFTIRAVSSYNYPTLTASCFEEMKIANLLVWQDNFYHFDQYSLFPISNTYRFFIVFLRMVWEISEVG